MDEKSDGEKGAEKRLMLMALINQYMMGDVDKYPALGVCSRLLPRGPQWDEFQSPAFTYLLSTPFPSPSRLLFSPLPETISSMNFLTPGAQGRGETHTHSEF